MSTLREKITRIVDPYTTHVDDSTAIADALLPLIREAQAEALEEAAAWAKETSERLGVGSYAHGPSGRERDLSDKYEHASWWLEARAAAYRVGEEADHD